ncbi:MAG: hypothetical protein BalsKO_05920 [Balneolaceae bacterium]
MKRLALIFFYLFVSFPISAQEKYFHELNGIEDSTGTTHLFYRDYESISSQCENDSEFEVTNAYNHVFHFNSFSTSDSIKFHDYYEPTCTSSSVNVNRVTDYDFYENDPSKWIIQAGKTSCYPYPVLDYKGRTLELPQICLTKEKTYVDNNFDNQTGFLLSNNEDSLYYNGIQEGGGIRVEILNDFSPDLSFTNEEEYGLYNNYISSVRTKFGVAKIHPKIDSLFYTKNQSGHLLISQKYSSTFQLADSTSEYLTVAFDADSSFLYSIVRTNSKEELKRSPDFGRANSWEFLNLPKNLNGLHFLETDLGEKGSLFISDSISVFYSADFGNSFDFLLGMDYQITGLYKKPGSQILYVLTTDELFEVNTITLEKTSLKKLPVSNEETEEVPSAITLHQNYPNPFNPTTTISFELNQPSEVTLTVFDALGRTVTTLVNEQKSTGSYSVNFDASNLSSGIYFYRLEAGAFIETKRLTLIK